MRWHIFAIFAFVLLTLEVGLRPLWHIEGGLGWISPSFTLILGAFVAMLAPSRPALWAMLILGLLTDLQPLPVGDGITVAAILGPAAVGFLLGGYAVLQFRGLLYRDSPFAVAAMVFVAGIFANLGAVALLTFRGLPLSFLSDPVAGWNAPDQLYHRFLQLLYTTLWALPLGWLLLRFQFIWGFESGKGMGIRRMG